VPSALTTGRNTFIRGGGEEFGATGAEATLHLNTNHLTELIDSIDKLLVVPAETTTYCVRANVVCESKHK